MSYSVNALTGGSSTTDATSYATAEATNTADALLLLFIQGRKAAAPPDPTSISWFGLSWTKIKTVTSTALNARRCSVWRAMGGAVTGTGLIDFGASTMTHCIWSLCEITGVNTSGSGGSGAIVQSVTSGDPATGTTGSVTLAATADSGNVCVGMFSHFANEVTTPGVGFTEIHDIQLSESATGFQTEYKTNDTTVDASWATNIDYLAIALEIQVAAAAAPAASTVSSNYRIELRNNNGILLSYIHNLCNSVSWVWNRIGGCGEANLKVQTAFDGVLAGSFTEDSEVRIYIPNVAGTSELWYSGFIDKVTPNLGSVEYVDLYCLGYVNQLKRVVVKDVNYESQEISVIVRNIAEVYATGNTSIVSTSPFYEDSQFTADTIYFNESAFDCITKLADIAGKTEWGVDENKKLFFKRRNDATVHFFNYKQDFTSFNPTRDFNEIITSIYLEGGDGYEQKFSVTNKIATKEVILSNSSISTQSVGYQYARSILKEKGAHKNSYQAKQIGRSTRVEATVPIGNCQIFERVGVKLKYDVATQLYDTNLKYDGGNLQLQIERIKYELRDDKINATISFGSIAPSISDDLAKLDYSINQVSNI